MDDEIHDIPKKVIDWQGTGVCIVCTGAVKPREIDGNMVMPKICAECAKRYKDEFR